MRRSRLLIGFFLSIGFFSYSQPLDIQLQSEYIHVWPEIFKSALTPVADKLDRPFVYVASNELGLRVYGTSPGLSLITTVDTNAIFMRPSTLTQRDTLLYLGLGSIFPGATDPAGMVIVNVADPTNPIVMDEWIHTEGNGTGIVQIQGDYAYVGAMSEGLIILNIADPNNISFVSQFIPDITFPSINNDSLKVNARGMTIVDSLVYLCYDAGGVRIINCADVNAPVQIGEFSNPITLPLGVNLARAYNNIVIEDTIAYIAADYCGLEVWSVADPSNVLLLNHWNPVGCPGGAWLNAPIHTNELIAQFDCDLLFISTGRSEMMVMDISDPHLPVAIDSFGTVTDNFATWAIDVTDENIYLTYLFTPLSIPFVAVSPGVRQLSYNKCAVDIDEAHGDMRIEFYPNPVSDILTIGNIAGVFDYVLYSLSGTKLIRGFGEDSAEINTTGLPDGMYLLKVYTERGVEQLKFVKAE